MLTCGFTFPFYLTGDVKIIGMSGRLKSNRKLASELHFDFVTKNIGQSNNKTLVLHHYFACASRKLMRNY